MTAMIPGDGLSLSRTLVLVGLMGAGKSCIGRRLAARLSMPFVDADTEIEKAAGCSVQDYFARHGEAAFRQGERKVMARLLDGPPLILASGGGAYIEDETRRLIAERAISLWLRADIELLIKRTSGRDHRPLLKNEDPHAVFSRLIAVRHPIYAQADLVVDSRDQPPEATVETVMEALRRHLAGCPMSDEVSP